MAEQTIYTVGGTVQAGGGIYISRKADDELFQHCRAGEYAFILSSRQVGKSSLMVRTAQLLEKEGIRSVIIDLSSIGVKISADEWYLGILDEIVNTLNLQTDIFAWWSECAGLSPATRMTNFFRDVLLKEVTNPVVIFFDEIDSTLSIPFADDFFAALRAIYNARSTVEEFKRLSFVMIGVASPSDLISDSSRTPFNIGYRVELNDFILEEVEPLAKGLGRNAGHVLSWVLNWTGGHPYLTQRLCAYLAKSANDLTESDVATAVEKLFLGEDGKKDNNLQFVRDMLLERARSPKDVLKIYQKILNEENIRDDEHSINKSHLKLAGVVRRRLAMLLKVSNRIYSQVFSLSWVKEHLPLIELQNFLEVRTFEWSRDKDSSRLLRGKELIEAERSFFTVATEKYRGFEKVQEFIQASRKAENQRKKRAFLTTVTILIAMFLFSVYAIVQGNKAFVAQIAVNAARTQSASDLATSRAESTRAASVDSTATAESLQFENISSTRVAASGGLDVVVKFVFDNCSCSGNFQNTAVLLTVNNGEPPYNIAGTAPVTLDNNNQVSFPILMGSSFPLEIYSSDGLSWVAKVDVPTLNSCLPPPNCTSGGNDNGNSCQEEEVTKCELVEVMKEVCIKWAGSSSKCLEWETQITYEDVCTIEMVCK